MTVDPEEYARPVRLLGMRGKDKKGVWLCNIDITTLEPHQAKAVAGEMPAGLLEKRAFALAVAYAYEQAGPAAAGSRGRIKLERIGFVRMLRLRPGIWFGRPGRGRPHLVSAYRDTI